MKWSSHAEIAHCVAGVLGMPSDLKELFVEASLDPDRNALHMSKDGKGGDERVRVRHHDPSRPELMRLLWKARKARLEGRKEDAVWCLGRALHYVQDMHVRTGPFMLRHDGAERGIARLAVDEGAAAMGMDSAIASPHYVRACLDRARPFGDPRLALDSATMLSSSIAFATLSDRAPSQALLRRWGREGRRHRYVVLPVAISGPIMLLLGAFAFGVPHVSVLSIPLFLATLCTDSHYYFDREEARWFGLAI
ncbi:MAG: hypothetical protein LUO79_03645 [Methanomassiliicoccales archaeon]|nr:hypothetical protein [Methanomassiliicoccales archaeon]